MEHQQISKRHIIVGTSGHIDHGKSALVKALTGIDPDTLQEEKDRGITIELGFVFMELPSRDREILFIDVPGHEKLVKTMVAGAANLDAAVFVVAADDGINIQTREHFDILRILDIPTGIIALTKCDLVDERKLHARIDELRGFVQGSFLADAPIIPVSSITGEGVQTIKNKLHEISLEVRERKDTGVFRMPVDRVFAMRGFGTVVAGTVLSGEVKVGDKVVVYPDGISTKIRGIQVHGKKSGDSAIGMRTAINLLNVDKDKLRRGQCLGFPGTLYPTARMDVKLNLLQSGKEFKNLTRVRFYTGTSETLCRVAILDRDKIEPGGSAPAQVILEKETVAMPGDRFVIRTLSPLFTVGGGTIVDNQPKKHKRFDQDVLDGLEKMDGEIDDQIEQLILKAGTAAIDTKDVFLAAGRNEEDVEASLSALLENNKIIEFEESKNRKFFHASVYQSLCEKCTTFLKDYFFNNPERLDAPFNDLRTEMLKAVDQGIFKFVLNNLIEEKIVFRKEAEIGLNHIDIPLSDQEKSIASRIEKILVDAGIESPIEENVRQTLNIDNKLFKKIISALIFDGQVIRLSSKVTYHTETMNKAKEIVLNLINKKGRISVAELRDELKVSRKYTQAILEYLNEVGVTKRVDDYHVLV